jgi:hypothetical protein
MNERDSRRISRPRAVNRSSIAATAASSSSKLAWSTFGPALNVTR